MPKWTKFWSLSRHERWTLIHAFVVLWFIQVGVRLMPLSHLRQVLERRAARRAHANRTTPDPNFTGTVAKLVPIANRFVPGKRRCLPEALAAQYLLIAHGHAAHIRFGATRDTRHSFKAHAWVESGGSVIVGSADLERFTKIVPPQPASK